MRSKQAEHGLFLLARPEQYPSTISLNASTVGASVPPPSGAKPSPLCLEGVVPPGELRSPAQLHLGLRGRVRHTFVTLT